MFRPAAHALTAALVVIAPAAVAASASPDAADSTAEKTSVRSRQLFVFKDDRIKESSGLGTSARFRRILYTHNDSGDDARFFAVGRNGVTCATYTLDGAGSRDWEAMAGGPNDTLWFGDIGANQLGREYISVFKVREPKRLKNRNIAWTRYDFVYGDGRSHNAEALLVNPVTGGLYVVTKAENGGGIYRAALPLSRRHKNTLHRVASAPVKVTAGDFSANGKRVVLRNYSNAYFYKRIGGRITAEARLPSGGESIAFARSGVGVYVGKEGVHSPVWRVVLRH